MVYEETTKGPNVQASVVKAVGKESGKVLEGNVDVNNSIEIVVADGVEIPAQGYTNAMLKNMLTQSQITALYQNYKNRMIIKGNNINKSDREEI